MKRMVKVTSAVAGVVLASTILVGSTMAAPPTPQGTPGTTTTPGTGLHQGGAYGMRGAPVWAGFEDEVATFLGMTQEQIQAERLAGKSLLQIAESKGKTVDQLTSVILVAKKADLDKAVADKAITQAQADLMYQNMQQQVPQMVNRTTVGPANGQGMSRQQNSTQNQTQRGGRGMMGRWAAPTN